MSDQRLYTYADLASFPDDGKRRELLDGELLVSPSPRPRHQRITGRLYAAFFGNIESGASGEVFIAPLDIVFSDRNVLEPDVFILGDDQADGITELNIQTVPRLVVEVVSDSRIDRIRKRELYERFGVPEYWVVDPDRDQVEIHRAVDGAYAAVEVVRPPGVVATPAAPGLEIDLAWLFRR